MKLYDGFIQKTESLLAALEPAAASGAVRGCAHLPASAALPLWPETAACELVLRRDAAFELGGSGQPSVNFACASSDTGLIPADEVLLYGPDLAAIKADSPYARIALVTVSGIDRDTQAARNADTGTAADRDEALYRAVREIDFIKYHVFPRGFMMRSSPQSFEEQVRVDRAELSNGMSFAAIGGAFIRHYHGNPGIQHVRLIFITDPKADYASLRAIAEDVDAVTKNLTHIMNGMAANCSSCQLKPLCDEVEGMRELHFRHNKS